MEEINKMTQNIYYKMTEGKKIYYYNHKVIGEEFEMKKHLVSELKMSFTKAKRTILKIKEWKDEKK